MQYRIRPRHPVPTGTCYQGAVARAVGSPSDERYGPLFCSAFEGPKGPLHDAWRGGNDREISARCAIRCDALLLPISQAPDRDLETISELMLSEAKSPA